MSSRTVFVTVGTTKFDDLIETVTRKDILQTFADLGYDSMTLQIGNGEYEPSESNIIQICYYRLKSSIKDDIQNASLVISHAGAGSCLEIMNERKPLIAVINEALMGNHQIEIAKALSDRGYLRYCNCNELLEVLKCKQFEMVKPYHRADTKRFSNYLDTCVGFYE